MPQLIILGLVLLLSQLSDCSGTSVEPTSAQSVQPTNSILLRKRMVQRSAWRTPAWMLVASGRTEEDEEILFEMLSDIARFQPFEKRLIPVKASQVSEEALGQQPVILVGNALSDSLWRRMGADRAGVFRGIALDRPNFWLRSFGLENPWAVDTSLALNIIYGANVKQLRQNLYESYGDSEWEALFRTRYGYLVDEGKQPRLKGFFSDEDWLPEPERELVFQAATAPAFADEGVRIFTPDGAPAPDLLATMARKIHQRKTQMARWFGLDTTPVLELHLYPSLERITLRLQDMQEVQYRDDDHQLHLSFAELERNLNSSEWHYCLLRWFRALEGTKALSANEMYLDRGLATLFTYGGLPPGLQSPDFSEGGLLLGEKLLNTTNRLDYGSYLYDYAAAHQLSSQPAGQIRQKLGMPELPDSIFSRRPANWQPEATGFQAGMTFAHEGYQVINGYGGSTVDASLDSLTYLNVNSIAVVPYGFQRHPNQLPELHVSESAGGENNAATRSSIRRAHNRGWSVMLKPQIWVGSDSWPGDIDFDAEEKWDKWFQRYSEWMMNFAIMATEEKVATLCIGTELRHTTLKHPEKWRNLIRNIRAVYPGRLTYAANWGDEFEQLTFWDALDVIGLNSYYPLSDQPAPDAATLRQGAQRWIAKAERTASEYNKSWWLTEVGYRSVDQSWINPHADAGDRSANEVDQQKCYAALFAELTQARSFGGMYIWKWPSFLGRGNGRRNGKIGFTPGGKAAAELVKQFYSKQLD